MRFQSSLGIWVLFCCIVLASLFVVLHVRDGGRAAQAAPQTAAGQQEVSAEAQENPGDDVPPPQPGSERYRNDVLRFAFDYPAGLAVRERVVLSSLTVAVQSAPGEEGLQLFVVPYEGETISKERFIQDVPSGILREQVDVVVDGAPGVAFYSENTAIGETYEIWFIRNGYLYEVTTYKELDTWLQEIVGAWKFF